MTVFIPKSNHSVVWGEKNIDFNLLYCDRKTIEIAVHPDSSVVVKVPRHSDIIFVEKKVIKRAGWICKQQNYFKQFQPKPPTRCYVSGETHLYLGKQYRLKVAGGAQSSVTLSHGFFHVLCRNKPNPDKVEKLLYQWYLEKAKVQFEKSLDRCLQKFYDFNFGRPKLSIRRMQKRWGSLSDKGTVTLNTDLIRASKECIDYVVTHELCHFQYANHGPEFYKLLSSLMPEWKKVKHKLELSTL